jgi:hypothetical protein
MRRRKDIPKLIQKKLFQEAGNRCQICGNDDVSLLEIHHILPVTENANHDPKHMIVLCANCHRKATRNKISQEALYSSKSRKSNIIPFPRSATAEPKPKQTVLGDGNITAGGDINVGNVNIRVSKGKTNQEIIHPGTVSEHARMIGYLRYLVRRYLEFRKWQADQDGVKVNPFQIHSAYKRELKYELKNTPVELFNKAVEFLQERIANTKLGRIKRKQGSKLFSDFERFDQETSDGSGET